MSDRQSVIYHGTNKRAAIARAKRIDGYVILARGPDIVGNKIAMPSEERGYWSDPSGLCRNDEQIVWPEQGR